MGKSKKTKTRLGYNVAKEDILDETDQFMEQKDEVSLIGDTEKEESDDEPNPLDLNLPEDEDDDEEEEGGNLNNDDDDDEDEEQVKKEAARQKGTAGWGKTKHQFYDADTKDFEVESDEEIAKDEEKESKRLQEERAKELEDADYEVPLQALVKEDPNKTKKGDKKTGNKQLLAMSKDLDKISLNLGSKAFAKGSEIEVEKVKKDLKNLSKDEKLSVIIADAPELLGLLTDLETFLKEIQDETEPLVKKIGENKLPTEKGLSFLECKQQVLLMYCSCVTFYLLLKAEGKPVKDHPVIKQLVHLRLMLEKMKPIGVKLKYQIDKLLKKNTSAAAVGLAADVEVADLSHKPRPDLLAPKEESSGALTSGTQLKSRGAVVEEEGVYRPPKITATSLAQAEKESEKRRNQKERDRERAQNQKEISHWRNLVLEKPEEQDFGGGAQIEQDANERERDKEEEDTFTRFMETKQDRKKRKARQSQTGVEDLDDFGDLASLVKKRKDDSETSLADLRNEKKGAKKGKVKFGNVDIPSDEDDFDFFGGGGGGDDMEGLEAYEKANEKSQNKKKQKKQKKQKQSPGIFLNEQDPDKVDQGGRRGAGEKIMKNRGLIPHRRKDIKIPRTKQREKWRQATKKRNSQVQEFAGKKSTYEGEKTGIKKNLTRSRKLKS